MEISGAGLTGLASQRKSSVSSALAVKSKPADQSNDQFREDAQQLRSRSRGRALSALRIEIRQALSERFQMRFNAPSAYSNGQGASSPRDVAAETLGAASELASNQPLKANNRLGELRKSIGDAASTVSNALADDDRSDMDNALARVNEGLNDLEADVSRNVESSASVLSAETRLKQRSTIRIRTQEGDVVRFDLRRVDKLSVDDVAVTDGDSRFSGTEVDFSSRTRMVLRVKGDLNESEQAAIQNVFRQAEAIAAEFFDGDLAAAFNMASGLEYDTEQLSRVNMLFREREVSTASFASATVAAPQPQPAAPPSVSVEPAVVKQEPLPNAPVQPTATDDPAAPVQSPPAAAPDDATVPVDDAIGSFMSSLSTFLRSLNEGFESQSGPQRYFYAESFKLEILKSVIQVSAPDGSEQAANSAAAVIDAVVGSSEQDD